MKTGLLLAFLAIAAPVAGQSIGGTIAGTAVDQSGARVTGAAVTIANTVNGRSHALVTGDVGEFRVVALQPASCRIIVESPGFARSQQELVLNVGSEATLSVTLTVAGPRETIQVAAASFGVVRSQPSSMVTRDDIESLPEIGRSFLVLAQLLPGSGPLNATVNRFAVTKFGGAADQRSGFTTMIDGGELDDTQWEARRSTSRRKACRNSGSSGISSTHSTATP